MGPVHDRRSPILHYPPPGSRLERYVQYFQKIDEGPPDWMDPDPTVRARGAQKLFRETKNLSDLPFPVVQEFILLPWLRDAGMPDGLEGEWFERLLDGETARLFDKFRAEEAERDRLPSKNKGGMPKAPIVTAAIVLAAYLDTAIDQWDRLTYTRRCEIVARRLSGTTTGSTIGRSTVLRIVKERLDQIAQMSMDEQACCWLNHAVFARFMSDCDQFDSFDRHVFYNSRAEADYSGTQPPVTFRSSDTRG